MKVLSLIMLFIIFIPAHTLSMGLVPVPMDEPQETVKTTAVPSSGKQFETSFISLARGHAIACEEERHNFQTYWIHVLSDLTYPLCRSSLHVVPLGGLQVD